MDNLREHGGNAPVPVDEERIPKSCSRTPCAARLAAVEISHATRDGDRKRGQNPGSAGEAAGSLRKRASGRGVRKWFTIWRVTPGKAPSGEAGIESTDGCHDEPKSMLVCSVEPAVCEFGLLSRSGGASCARGLGKPSKPSNRGVGGTWSAESGSRGRDAESALNERVAGAAELRGPSTSYVEGPLPVCAHCGRSTR